MGDLGVGVGRPRHDQPAQSLAAQAGQREEGVLDADAGHGVGRVRELITARDVARRENPRIGGLQEVVYHHSAAVVLNARRGEVQSFDIGRTAGGDENRVGVERLLAAAHLHIQPLELTDRFGAERCGFKQQLDALAGELPGQDLRRVGLVLGQQALGPLHERDVAAEAAEGLRQLAADGSAADDDQPRRAAR